MFSLKVKDEQSDNKMTMATVNLARLENYQRGEIYRPQKRRFEKSASSQSVKYSWKLVLLSKFRLWQTSDPTALSPQTCSWTRSVEAASQGSIASSPLTPKVLSCWTPLQGGLLPTAPAWVHGSTVLMWKHSSQQHWKPPTWLRLCERGRVMMRQYITCVLEHLCPVRRLSTLHSLF